MKNITKALKIKIALLYARLVVTVCSYLLIAFFIITSALYGIKPIAVCLWDGFKSVQCKKVKHEEMPEYKLLEENRIKILLQQVQAKGLPVPKKRQSVTDLYFNQKITAATKKSQSVT